MFILGVAIFLFMIWLAITILGGNVDNYISIPSQLIVFAPLLGTLAATRSFKVFYGGLKAVILPKSSITEELRGQAMSLFRLLSKVTAMAVGIGALIGLTNVLYGLDLGNPDVIHILGINAASALLSLVHGLFIIAAVFEPVVFNLKKRRDADRK